MYITAFLNNNKKKVLTRQLWEMRSFHKICTETLGWKDGVWVGAHERMKPQLWGEVPGRRWRWDREAVHATRKRGHKHKWEYISLFSNALSVPTVFMLGLSSEQDLHGFLMCWEGRQLRRYLMTVWPGKCKGAWAPKAPFGLTGV